MKKFLTLVLVLCICATSLMIFSSCEDKGKINGSETEKAEQKEFAEAKLANKIKSGMTREEVRTLMEVAPIKHENADLYRLSNGNAAYVGYSKGGEVNDVSIEKMLDSTLVGKIKEGYSYEKITEIFGGNKGRMITSGYWGVYRYVLSDGRLLYIGYDGDPFSTSIHIEAEGGEVTYPCQPPQDTFSFESLDKFKQHLSTTYASKEAKIAVPKLISDEYKLGKAVDSKACFGYSYVLSDHDQDDALLYTFFVKVYKNETTYTDMVDFYRTAEKKEVIEFKDGVAFVKNYGMFIFDNNGKALVIDIPAFLREDNGHLRDENSPSPITDLEELNKYLTVEQLDLSK